MVEYDEQLALETERSYLMPEIALQRARTLAALQLKTGEQVLDVGCGMGLLARDMALAIGRSGRVVGIDNSDAMIRLAQRRCRDMPQIELRAESADALPDPDNTYDVITCTQLLLYLSDVPSALAEMQRVLKPGGRIAIIETDWNGVVFNTMDHAFTRQLFDGWNASIPSPNLPGQLPSLLTAAGFAAIRVEAIPLINTSYLLDNYSGGMIAYMLRSQDVDEATAEAYVADLEARSTHGEYFFCVNRFLFVATKLM